MCISSSFTVLLICKGGGSFSTSRIYSRKLLDPMVCATASEDKQIFEPKSELIDTLLAEISTPRKICLS